MATKKASTKKAGATNGSASNITDIPHEEIKDKQQPPAVVQAVEVEVLSIEQQITREIAKFNRADAGIEALKKEYGELTIAGPEDKEGYNAVKKAWNLVRTTRTDIEKKKKEIKADYIKIGKAIDGEEQRLVELISPLEDDLYNKWKKIDDDKEAEKERLKKEEEEKLHGRINELVGLGMRFVDGFYSLGDAITMDVATLRTMPDEKYLSMLVTVKKKNEELKAEEKRLQDEKDKEAQRLKEEQQKLDDDRKKLEKEKEDLEKMKAEAAQAKKDIRIMRLNGIGMLHQRNRSEFVYNNGYNDVTIHQDDIFGLSDEEFDKKLADLVVDIKEKANAWETYEQQKAEEQRIHEEKTALINSVMIDKCGLNFNFSSRKFVFSNPSGSIESSLDELMGMSVDQIREVGNNLLDSKGKLEKLEVDRKADEDKKAEAERIAGMNDGQLWEQLISTVTKAAVWKGAPPKTKKYKDKLAKFTDDITNLLSKHA